ncbi:MAG: DUF2939 domain-containing protein [Telluria sp.]
MTPMKAALSAALAVAVFAGISYASPYYQLSRMRAAAEARDAQTLAQYVDFPALRASVKQQVMHRLGAGGVLAEPASNPFAAFGKAMASAVIDPVVNAAVSPEGVAAMLDAGDIRLQPKHREAGSVRGEGPREHVDYALGYRSWRQVVVERTDGDGAAFILDRDGVWGWKLAGIELRG